MAVLNRFIALEVEDEENVAPAPVKTVTATKSVKSDAPKKQEQKKAPTKAPRTNDDRKNSRPESRPSERSSNASTADREESDDSRPRGKGGRGKGAGSRGKGERGRRDGGHGASRRDGEKKQENGPGNWGKEGDESAPAEPAATTTESPAATPVEAEVIPEKEEEKTITLEEYEASLKEKRVASSVASERKAGEGEKSKWENTQALDAEAEQEVYFVGKSAGGKNKERKERKSKETLDVAPKAYHEEQSRSRGRKGGKGEDNSEGRRGSGRRMQQAAPVATDLAAFPAIGK